MWCEITAKCGGSPVLVLLVHFDFYRRSPQYRYFIDFARKRSAHHVVDLSQASGGEGERLSWQRMQEVRADIGDTPSFEALCSIQFSNQ